MNITLSCHEVLETTGGTLMRGDAHRTFRALGTDSRAPLPEGLFIPLRGDRFDGHDFLLAAVEGGASGILLEKGMKGKGDGVPDGIAVIRVQDTLRALGDLARHWRRKFTLPVAAVTGSSGKTTTKEMLAAIAGITKRVLKTEGTRNNLVGLPLTLLELREDHELAVVEFGTNHPGEIARLTAIAEPDLGIITNTGTAHLEGLGSLKAIQAEKADLFVFMKQTGVAIINLDDEAAGMLGRRWSGKTVTFGLGKGGRADVMAEGVVPQGAAGTAFTLKLPDRTVRVRLPAPGVHNVANALAAAAAAAALGCDADLIRRGLEAFRPAPRRMEIHPLGNGAYLIDDTYNANPASVQEAMKTLADLRGEGGSLVILGDMLELGESAAEMHERVGAFAASSGVRALFTRGRYAEAVARGARREGMPPEKIHIFTGVDEILAYVRLRVKKGDWILVKGSRQAHMEEVAAEIIAAAGLAPAPAASGT
jgi:UDP-N-acetylmuramoyl-tripeptide--D-alanyl-D-alanine ligase